MVKVVILAFLTVALLPPVRADACAATSSDPRVQTAVDKAVYRDGETVVIFLILDSGDAAAGAHISAITHIWQDGVPLRSQIQWQHSAIDRTRAAKTFYFDNGCAVRGTSYQRT